MKSPLSKAVTQWGNVGGLVAGFALRDVALIGRSMQDVVVEPYRKGFIPDYDVLKASALSEGALALNIAGSGPSVFALASDYAVACRVADRMKAHFAERGIASNTYAGRVSNAGARVVEQTHKAMKFLQYTGPGAETGLYAPRGRHDGTGPRRWVVRSGTDSAGRSFRGGAGPGSRTAPWRATWRVSFFGEDLDPQALRRELESLYDFPVPLRRVGRGRYTLELFHGPTCAFKDFGAGFMGRAVGLWGRPGAASSSSRPRRAIRAVPWPTDSITCRASTWWCSTPRGRSAACRSAR